MLKNLFIRWYFDEFTQQPYFQEMNNTTENSPWHREGNVGIHTNMVVAEYLSLSSDEWGRDELVGALACAFHDVGKPAACEKNGIKWKAERGNYLSFGGHEQISARMWEDYAVRNWTRLTEVFKLHPFDIYAVGWMIEYHLPWGIKKVDKINNIALTSMFVCDPEVYTNVLLADTYGRISDDQDEKRAKTRAWVDDFHANVMTRLDVSDTEPENDQPVLLMPIGASGTGKSTYRDHLDDDIVHYSWDDLRLEFYDKDYRVAYEMSLEDKEFGNRINARFMENIKSGKDIYVDNINVSKKRRAFFVREARRKGYFVRAILFPISKSELISRQATRTDKTIPVGAVTAHYSAIQYPQFGEFDDVQVVRTNLPEFA